MSAELYTNFSIQMCFVFCRKLVPEEQRPERNKQLCSLVVNIAIVVSGLVSYYCWN
jgi:hypothetical protein